MRQLDITWIPVAFLFAVGPAVAQLEIGGDPRVDPDDFRITTFATRLNFPLGMAELPDGSILATVNRGSSFYGSTRGQIVRFADADDDGVADSETVIYDALPEGQATAVRAAGNLVFACGSSKPIVILRAGATPDAPLTLQGTIEIEYPDLWRHPNSTLAVRETPERPGSYDLLFQLGSTENLETDSRTLPLTSDIGLNAELVGDAIYMITISDHGDSVTGADLVQLATGARNAAGLAFHPATGDLYFQDNGIDGLVSAGEAHSADEINLIPAADIGGEIEDFGFPDSYVHYRTGDTVGERGIDPFVAFLPIPEPADGEESEGANDITFAPPGFPPGLNNGLFVGFHGEFSDAGPDNAENPLVYVDLESGEYFHFVDTDQAGIGHLDGLLATRDALYVADLSTVGSLGNSGFNNGVIYQIKSLASTAVQEVATGDVPDAFELAAAYPNPFNGSTLIRFSLTRNQEIEVAVYNMAGQKVLSLVDGFREAGSYTLRWDGRGQYGQSLGSGIYLYRLRAAEQVQSRKLVLLR